jgi:hypothetical protein
VVSRQLLDSLTARLVFLSFRVSKRMRCLLRPLAIALNEVRVTMLQHPFITGPLAEQRRARCAVRPTTSASSVLAAPATGRVDGTPPAGGDRPLSPAGPEQGSR